MRLYSSCRGELPPKKPDENIRRPNITNGLTQIIVNKPENYVVKADLVARSRRQSKDHPHEIVDIPLDDIGQM